MANYQAYDPWEMASNPRQLASGFWGKVEIDVWTCALVKGVGKVPYNPAEHGQPNTAIDLAILPLPEQNVQNTKACERHLIAESTEWSKITWQSLKDLGITSVKDVREKWAHVEAVPTGKTYDKVNDQTGEKETRDKTEFKFIALFDNEEACLHDFQNSGSYVPASNQAANPAPAAQPAATPAPAAPAAPAGQENVAIQFLRVIVKNACKDSKDLETIRNAVATQIAGYPVVKNVFTVDSPETMNLIAEYMQQ